MKTGYIKKVEVSNPIIEQVKQTISNTHCNGGIIVECF
jgi:hypothetical protein